MYTGALWLSITDSGHVIFLKDSYGITLGMLTTKGKNLIIHTLLQEGEVQAFEQHTGKLPSFRRVGGFSALEDDSVNVTGCEIKNLGFGRYKVTWTVCGHSAISILKRNQLLALSKALKNRAVQA